MKGLWSLFAVNLILWSGLFGYLLWIHRKIKDLEKEP